MSGVESQKCLSLVAGANLSALQFTAIGLGADKLAASAVAATAPIIGILQNKPDSGQAATVAFSGVTKALVGSGGWNSGSKLTATTGGALIETTTAGNHYVGIALEDASAGDYAQVLIQPGMVAGA